MFLQPPKERERTSWIVAAIWAASIFAVIPLARAIQNFVDERWGRELFLWVVAVYIAVFVLIALVYLLYSRESIPVGNAAWLIAIAAVFLYWTWQLRRNPEEALHFIQYGILSLLVYRALTHRIRDPSIYVVAVLICSVTGTVDEMVQWMMPRRYFDFRDIWINGGAAILVQAGLLLGIRPGIISGLPGARGLRMTCRLGTAQLLLFGICLSNTHERAEWYAERIPLLSFLQNNPSVMAEYGYRHIDPEIGVFFSRFSPEQLKEEDRIRGREAAEIISRWHDPRRYPEFLETYTPYVNALAHEARVRIFRRDRYRAESRARGTGDPEYAHALTVAYREYRIMEKYYPVTLNHSRYRMSESYIEYLSENQIPDFPYVSAVSAHLITRWREWQLWSAILAGVLVLQAVNGYYGRRLEQIPVWRE